MRITKSEMMLELVSMFNNHKINTAEGMDGMAVVLNQAKCLGKKSYKKFCLELGLSAYSRPNWTRVPGQTGQPFQRKLDTDSTPNWTVIPA
jgi:hypothetical protein